jgi:hypothetical protein
MNVDYYSDYSDEDLELVPDSEPTRPRARVFEASGVFGRGERRLGVRAQTKFTAFLTAHGQRARARTVDLSTTGVVLDLRFSELAEVAELSTLELVVPGLGQPIRTVARPVRLMGKLQAFEFVSIRQVDRLTLAEHLDRLRREEALRA